MSVFERITIESARERLEQGAVLLDIRDLQSFLAYRHQKAQHLTNDTIDSILEDIAFSTPMLVVCYHGHSSQNIAQYLVSLGYLAVYSVDGGMTQWFQSYQEDCIEGR